MVFRYGHHAYSGEKVNSFVLVLGVGEERDGLWVAKELFLFRIFVKRSNESQEYAFLYYMV